MNRWAVCPGHDHELVVVLEHAGVEEAGDLELPESRHRHAERRIDLGLGDRHQGDDVARVDRQPGGQPGAEEDAAVHARLGGLEREIAFVIAWGSEVTDMLPVSGSNPSRLTPSP